MTGKKNGTNKTIALVVVIVVAFGLGVAVGFKKAKYKSQSGSTTMADFQSMSPEERRGMFSGDHGGAGAPRGGVGMTSGEVLSIDEGSVTIDLGEEGSKLILLTDETTVLKSQDVGLEGLVEGDNVFVNGETSDDGTVIAEIVTVRPEGLGNRKMEQDSEKIDE